MSEKDIQAEKPVGVLKKLTDEERQYLLDEAQEKARRDRVSRMRGAMQAAKHETNKEIAVAMFRDGRPAEIIEKYTGLTVAEVQRYDSVCRMLEQIKREAADPAAEGQSHDEVMGKLEQQRKSRNE